VFALIGRHALWLMIVSRVVLLPVIASLGYEAIYFGANHSKNALVRAIMAPGLWLQGMTAKEPDDSQIEVALAAMAKALEIDQTEETAPA
ncbi:MAG: DUF1385 domain-containing protein, partial [Chloroflexi bacterium]|nr:DUF1385 domain-containing protein [Chloroflexota bacterium]